MAISSLNMSDIILIKAHFEYLYKLRCDSVIQDHVNNGYTYEIASKTVKGERGCGVISKDPIYQIDNIQYNTCPCMYKHPNMDFFMQAEKAFDKGILPFSGSLIDQPSYIIEAINLIQVLKLEYQAGEQSKANQKQGK